MANEPYATLIIGEGPKAKETPLTQDEYVNLLENGLELQTQPSGNIPHVRVLIIFLPASVADKEIFQVTPDAIALMHGHVLFIGVFQPEPEPRPIPRPRP